MIIPFSKSTVEPSICNYRLECTLWVACDYSITLCLCYEWGPTLLFFSLSLFAPVSPLSLSYIDTTGYSRSPVRWAMNHRVILKWTNMHKYHTGIQQQPHLWKLTPAQAIRVIIIQLSNAEVLKLMAASLFFVCFVFLSLNLHCEK